MQYITNVENQVKSAKNYLEQEKLRNKFKVIQYKENDFVHSLGFVTPFLKDLQNLQNITEIIIDSTFKTNQECFELFVLFILLYFR
ncbi:12818_t:CDS:2 [Cetraspora pellucida]|uniref:12818_t:CDS:1 n=1 Tax=Cetraspora pellucida TaxID=1433469 RepID=A0A9N9B701_9GLOM|nr:12818_t:CDS:2 [Cetraspora pellucida]